MDNDSRESDSVVDGVTGLHAIDENMAMCPRQQCVNSSRSKPKTQAPRSETPCVWNSDVSKMLSPLGCVLKSEPNPFVQGQQNQSCRQGSGLERAFIALGLTLKFASEITSIRKGMLETVK